MRKILRLIGLLIFSIITSQVFAAIDFQCMNECARQGSMYGFCQSRCSYNATIQMNKRVDYTCLNSCTRKGYMYSYCQQSCSY